MAAACRSLFAPRAPDARDARTTSHRGIATRLPTAARLRADAKGDVRAVRTFPPAHFGRSGPTVRWRAWTRRSPAGALSSASSPKIQGIAKSNRAIVHGERSFRLAQGRASA
jgi:hypothetical protein